MENECRQEMVGLSEEKESKIERMMGKGGVPEEQGGLSEMWTW